MILLTDRILLRKMAKHGDAANTKPVTTAHTARHPIETRRIGGKAGRSRYACRFGNDVRPFEHVTHAWSTHRPSAWPYRVCALPNYPLALASPFPIHIQHVAMFTFTGSMSSSVEISLISNMFFSHKSLHTYALHHACRTPGWAGGYISSLSKSLIAWRAHYAIRGCGRCLAVSCLNQSIIWFRQWFRALPPLVRSSRAQRVGW